MTNEQLYVFNQTNGAVTVPVGGSWIAAYCIYLGVTEPVNGTWLQALCEHFGITQPLYGSWLIALADYYGISAPENGTWMYAISQAGGVPTDLIWNLVNTQWQNETTPWKTATAPSAPVFPDVTFTDDAFPSLVGTADPNMNIYLSVDSFNYETTSDGLGNWTIELIDALPQALSPGNDYIASTYAFDPTTGLTSSTTLTTITMITTVVEKLVVANLYDSYGDGWNGGWIVVQKETSPSVWESIEYNENPFRFGTITQHNNYINSGDMTGAQYYKTDFITGAVSGIYGIRFETYEPGVTNNGVPPTGGSGFKTCENLRSLSLLAGNYRVIIGRKGSYPAEQSYQLIIDGTPSTLVQITTGMNIGDTIQTFTL